MKKKILFTVLIGMIVMFQSMSFGAEFTIYGSGGITINAQSGDVIICPKTDPSKVCATLKIEGDEVKIITGDLQSNCPGQGINGEITTEDGQLLEVHVIQGYISNGSGGCNSRNNFNIKVINP